MKVSVDKFHKQDARLYVMLRNMHQSDGHVITTEAIPQPLKPLLDMKYPEVDKVTLNSRPKNSVLVTVVTTGGDKGVKLCVLKGDSTTHARFLP